MIYLECEADKILVNVLGVPRKEIKHVFGKGNVCNNLKRNKNSKGLMDDDPLSYQPRHIDKFRVITDKDNIKLLYDDQNKNHLIILCPRLEEWILNVIRETKVDITNYDLPNDAYKLHKTINTNLKKFKKLIEDVKQQSKILKTLEEFIKS